MRLFVALLVGILTLGYMAPWAVAYAIEAPRTKLTFWINLVFGWTGIGWFVAWATLLMDSPARKKE